MKNILLKTILLTLTLFLFLACSVKINPTSINRGILPNQLDDVTTFLNSKTYNTYDDAEGKITSYYFKTKEGMLQASNEIIYIPLDATDQLYSPFSQVTLTINRLTNYRAKTLEEALDMEVRRERSTLLYINKNEYIIGNDFARDIKYAIREFEEKMRNQEDRESKINMTLIIPVF